MTCEHQHLVESAAKWLQRDCAVVITELATNGETPDAIGWRGTCSTLVECKVSRADFVADKAKCFRQAQSHGIGMRRYFLSVPGIIKVEELPDKWGLLEVAANGGIKVLRESDNFEPTNQRHEIGILISSLRRIGKAAPIGVSIKYYTFETKNRATLGVVER